MDSARHVIKRILSPRFLTSSTFYDVASPIHESLQMGEYALDFDAAWLHVAADGRRIEAASVQGDLHVLNPETGELEAVSAAAALADFGLSGLDGGGRTVMRVVALSTAAVGQCGLTPG
jgi:hypothetical protein